MFRLAFTTIVIAFLVISCKQEGDTYITNVTAPDDWHPPIIEWRSQPDPEVRGTVGIDFVITDSSEVASVRAYLDGAPTDSTFSTPYRFELITDSLLDGVHVVEVRATDAYGNLGISPVLRINVVNSVAQGPQLIWVPDNYSTIQSAINASTDFDTIRVRSGTYYETLNTFGKGIWLESELGPMTCSINANGANSVFWVAPSSVASTIRGFRITGGNANVSLDQVRMNFYNNVVASDGGWTNLITSYSGGNIQNNLFQGSETSLQFSTHFGVVFNNIIQNASSYGMWNAATFENPIMYGYNLFWQNTNNYNLRFDPGIGDIYEDPLINFEEGYLLNGSPAIDGGHPEIFDLNGTRSDIGPFGGPYAYSISEGQNHRKGANHGKLGQSSGRSVHSGYGF